MIIISLRNTINRVLVAVKAAESLQITGSRWNQKGNMLLYTHCGFKNLDFDLHQDTIANAVQQADPQTLNVNKQETWNKISIHGINIEEYANNNNGMEDH